MAVSKCLTMNSIGSGVNETTSIAKVLSVSAGSTKIVFDELMDIGSVIDISNTYSGYNCNAYKDKDTGTYVVYGTYPNLFTIQSVNGNEVTVYHWVAQSIKIIATGI